MAVGLLQAARDGEVALGGDRVDVGRGAAVDPGEGVEGDVAGFDSPADPVELAPGGKPLDIDVAAEAERMDRRADVAFEVAERGEVDEREALRLVSEKEWPGARSTLAGPRRSAAAKSSKKASIARRPASVSRLPSATTMPSRLTVRMPVASSKRRRELGEALVPHQHEKGDLGQVRGRGRIEARGTVLDRVGAVEGNRLVRHQIDGRQWLGGQALDWIAVECGDPGGLSEWHFFTNFGLEHRSCPFLGRECNPYEENTVSFSGAPQIRNFERAFRASAEDGSHRVRRTA